MKGFKCLFVDELKEIYASESQLVKILTGAIELAKFPELKNCLRSYLEDTKKHLRRLEQISQELKENFSNADSEPMKGFWKEYNRIAKTHYEGEAQDCALVCLIQKIKHYEIATYGTLKSFAKHLRFPKIENWLKESSHEAGLANKHLTEIAEGTMLNGGLNVKACRKSA